METAAPFISIRTRRPDEGSMSSADSTVCCSFFSLVIILHSRSFFRDFPPSCICLYNLPQRGPQHVPLLILIACTVWLRQRDIALCDARHQPCELPCQASRELCSGSPRGELPPLTRPTCPFRRPSRAAVRLTEVLHVVSEPGIPQPWPLVPEVLQGARIDAALAMR